jgi:hypothetical protein
MPTGSPTKPDRLSSRGVYRIPRHRVELGGRDEVLQGRQCDLINRDSKIYFAPGSQYLSQIGIGAGSSSSGFVAVNMATSYSPGTGSEERSAAPGRSPKGRQGLVSGQHDILTSAIAKPKFGN